MTLDIEITEDDLTKIVSTYLNQTLGKNLFGPYHVSFQGRNPRARTRKEWKPTKIGVRVSRYLGTV